MEKMIYAILSVKNNPEKLNALLSDMKCLSGADLYTVPFEEIVAVVSDIKRSDVIADRSNAIEYAGVIETLMEQFTLLPVRFGSIFESSDAISQMLERNYPEIQSNIEKVKNKIEFGLKVFCDSEKIKSEIESKSEANKKIPTKPELETKNSLFKDYVNKKLKEHRFEESLLAYVDSVISEITGYLARLNAVNKFKKMSTATTIIDAVFLLDKKQKDALIKAVGDLQNQYPGLNFILTGPWPPYNFVDFTVK